MTGTSLLLDALAFAADRHRSQKRKGADGYPYINHTIAVAHVLSAEGGVEDPSILAAAFLHDTVEDTPTSLEELGERFGPAIRDLVQELTDDKSLPKERRKELQVQHAPHASPAAKQLKIADKIANIRDLTDAPPADWTMDRKREYVAWAERVVRGCRGVNPRLDAAFDAAVARATSLLGTLALCLLALLPAPARAQGPDAALRAELVRMYEEDQRGRAGIAQAVQRQDTAFILGMMRADSARSRRLEAIVARHGWPRPALAGEDGARAAWFILQHSPMTEFQARMLPEIWAAARRGEAPLRDAAMLEDRVRVRQGLRQRYGNGFTMVNDTLVLEPYEDPAGMAARRREVGLPPLREYADTLRRVYQVPVQLPAALDAP